MQVNKLARRKRHLRIFSKGFVVKLHLLGVAKFFAKPIVAVSTSKPVVYTGALLASVRHNVAEILPIAPAKRLFFQAGLLSTTFLLITSFTASSSFSAVTLSYSNEYISDYATPGDVLVSDEDGYLVKMNPLTDNANRIGMTDFAVHTVESGETLSLIAGRYGVSVNTIMWQNGLPNANALRNGQKLMIPPVDGVGYQVSKGDSLQKIAKSYSISVDAIIAQNNLDSEVVNVGQNLFLPGAKPLAPPVIAGSNSRNGSVGRSGRSVTYTDADRASATPSGGAVFIFPTIGTITQGFKAGHYALDIGNRSMPPVWAAGGGTVVKVSTGTWGGGYGNHIIIDHGDGLKTLYAHLDSVSVENGQWVSQGDVVGVMGKTGRVYGATGIHLHWEVIDNGVKKYPANYY